MACSRPIFIVNLNGLYLHIGFNLIAIAFKQTEKIKEVIIHRPRVSCPDFIPILILIC
mgnify:CR=1 FL=1